MQQYLVGEKLMDFNKLIFISNGGDDANNGKIDAPVKTVFHALELVSSNDDAIVFLPGEYELEPNYTPWNQPNYTIPSQSGAFVAPKYVKSIETAFDTIKFIGQAKDTLFNYDASKSSGKAYTTGLVFQGKVNLYRMNIKMKPNGSLAWQNALTNYVNDGKFYNCAVENIGTTKMSMINATTGYTANFYNCAVKNNGKNLADYTYTNNKMNEIKQTQFDWDYTNAVTIENKLVRTITDDDLMTGSASDLNASDGSKIGVYGSEYTWAPDVTGHLVSMRYQDEDGNELQADEIRVVMQGGDYTANATAISGYSLIGHKLDGDMVQPGGSVDFTAVDSDRIVTFVYKKGSEVNVHILLDINETVDLTGYIHPVAPNVPQLIWSSDDAAIASVDADGKVTGNALGITKIHVKTPDDSWSAFVRVIVEAEGASDLRLSILLEPGETCRLKALFVPDGTSQPVIWSSSNTAVATVNSNGKVTALAEGEAIITVQTVDGSLSDYIYVTVTV